MLANHRRALWYALALLAATVAVFAAVGRHPPHAAPQTTLPWIGDWDLALSHWSDDIRSGPLTFVARVLNVVGGGVVTIPLRIAIAAWLAFRTRWRALAAWALTWAGAEIVLAAAKSYYHRDRPPGALVDTVGFAFPSGHAVAAAATAVALVLVLMEPGPARRRWEWAAAAFAFVMASSRVYLRAHWLSDVVAGVLLGAGLAVGVAGILTEIRDRALHLGAHAEPLPTRAGPSARE